MIYEETKESFFSVFFFLKLLNKEAKPTIIHIRTLTCQMTMNEFSNRNGISKHCKSGQIKTLIQFLLVLRHWALLAKLQATGYRQKLLQNKNAKLQSYWENSNMRKGGRLKWGLAKTTLETMSLLDPLEVKNF